MNRLPRAIAIVNVCLGVLGVAGGTISLYKLIRWLGTEAPQMMALLDMAAACAGDALLREQARRLEEQIAAAKDEAHKAEFRRKLEEIKRKIEASGHVGLEFREGIRKDAIRFTIADCVWIAASAFLIIGGIRVLRGVGRPHKLLIVTLVLIPLSGVITGLLRAGFFLPSWNDFFYAILSVGGVSRLLAVRIGIGVVGLVSVVVYPAVALVLLCRSYKAQLPGAEEGIRKMRDPAKAIDASVARDADAI